MGRAFNQAPDSLVEAAMSEHETVHQEHSPTKNWPSQILWRHPKPSGDGKPEPPVEDCPDHDARAESTWSKCAGPRRLLPRRERLRVQAALHYEYQARPLSLGEMKAGIRDRAHN